MTSPLTAGGGRDGEVLFRQPAGAAVRGGRPPDPSASCERPGLRRARARRGVPRGCSSAGPARGVDGGADVLIEVKHVVWVEAGFETGEPLELLRPVGVADAVCALDTEVVDVDASAVGCYLVGVQAGAGASDVVFAGVGPAGGGHELEPGAAVADRGVLLPDPGDGAAPGLQRSGDGRAAR